MYCPFCQGPLDQEDHFCANCGQRLPEGIERPITPSQETPGVVPAPPPLPTSRENPDEGAQPAFCARCGAPAVSGGKLCLSCKAKQRTLHSRVLAAAVSLVVLCGAGAAVFFLSRGVEPNASPVVSTVEPSAPDAQERSRYERQFADESEPQEPESPSSPAPQEVEREYIDWDAEIARKIDAYQNASVEYLPVGAVDYCESFQDNVARCKIGDSWGLLDTQLQFAAAPQYEDMLYFGEGLAAVRKDGKWGFINEYGDVEILPQWDMAARFSEGLCPVMADGRYGYIDRSNELVIPLQYQEAKSFSEGYAAVRLDGKWGYIGSDGGNLTECLFDTAAAFTGGLALVQEQGHWGFIDTSGEYVVEALYDDAISYVDGYARVKAGGKWGLIDTSGDIVVPIEWDNVWNYSEGLATAQKGDLYGFVDENGEVAIQPRYASVWACDFGLIPVQFRPNGEWGYVDRNGDERLPAQYNEAHRFVNGVSKVLKDGKYALIDMEGSLLTGYDYKVIGYIDGELVPVQRSETEWGYLRLRYD